MSKKIVQVQFAKTVRMGTSAAMHDYLVGDGASHLPASRVEEAPVELSLSENEQFVRISVRGGKVVHLIPMSNIASIILEASK